MSTGSHKTDRVLHPRAAFREEGCFFLSLLPTLAQRAPDDLFLRDIDNPLRGLLGDSLLDFFEFHRDVEVTFRVGGLDIGDAIFLLIDRAVLAQLEFRVPNISHVHFFAVGLVEFGQDGGEIGFGGSNRVDAELFFGLLAPDEVLVGVELLGEKFDDLLDLIVFHRLRVAFEETLGEDFDQVVRPMHIAQGERMDGRGALDEFVEHFGEFLVALDSEFVLSQVEIAHHFLDRNRDAVLRILRIDGIEDIGRGRVDRRELGHIGHDDLVGAEGDHRGCAVSLVRDEDGESIAVLANHRDEAPRHHGVSPAAVEDEVNLFDFADGAELGADNRDDVHGDAGIDRALAIARDV